MYSELKQDKIPSLEILPSDSDQNSKIKDGSETEPVICFRGSSGPKLRFTTTKRRRWYYQTRSKKRDHR